MNAILSAHIRRNLYRFSNHLSAPPISSHRQCKPISKPHQSAIKTPKSILIRVQTPGLHSPERINQSSPKRTMVTSQDATPPTEKAIMKDDARTNFLSVFDDVVDLLMADIGTKFDLPQESRAYLRKVVTYNVPHGKLNRGLAVFQCYKAFAGADAISADDEYRASILGWCVELLQAFFLVADDIMDDSRTRRGQPCFFRLPDVGLNAINDSIILEMMIYRLLHLKFGSDCAYTHLVALFQDISYTTEMGQMLDLTSQPKGRTDFSRFSDDVLARIYKYKTSHYTFYLPVALGMRLAGVSDIACYETAKQICLQMGHYFQAQDDVLDAFGDPAVTGKVGTDIEENTCTWLVVEALKTATPQQRQILQNNYGIKNVESAQRVKQVYRELKLEDKFLQFEQESYVSIAKQIEQVKHMPTGAFDFLLAKIYKRAK